jgi:hypothetical protein
MESAEAAPAAPSMSAAADRAAAPARVTCMVFSFLV